MTKSLIVWKNLKNKKYGYVICLSDGYYKGGVGEKLVTEIKSQKDLLKLNDSNFIGQKYYGSGETMTLEELLLIYEGFGIEYIYLFLHNKWYIISDSDSFMFKGVVE